MYQWDHVRPGEVEEERSLRLSDSSDRPGFHCTCGAVGLEPSYVCRRFCALNVSHGALITARMPNPCFSFFSLLLFSFLANLPLASWCLNRLPSSDHAVPSQMQLFVIISSRPLPPTSQHPTGGVPSALFALIPGRNNNSCSGHEVKVT